MRVSQTQSSKLKTVHSKVEKTVVQVVDSASLVCPSFQQLRTFLSYLIIYLMAVCFLLHGPLSEEMKIRGIGSRESGRWS